MASSLKFVGVNNKKIWKELNEGFICPFIKCSECNSELIWYHDNIKKEIEQLNCSKCKFKIHDDEIILTKKRMRGKDVSPDILFTTTEMMNQNLSETRYRKLFGIVNDRNKKPSLVLLDEVHTYTGTHGAQVAYLIRRWRSLVGSKIDFVGLSATIADGSRFFSRLVNIRENFIKVIEPRLKDNITKGSEYLIALKGDPVSKSALLSTSIQTLMLLSRMLDNRGNSYSENIYGNKVYAFTDDIDVTNRMYHALLDAEGRKDDGGGRGGQHISEK